MLQYMLNAHYLDRYDPNEILNYGCWCQTSPDHEKHRRGTPVDSVDRKCQNWYRCTKCIRIDSFGSCLPESKNYHVTLNFLTGRYECSFDSDVCAAKTCACDVELANQIAKNAAEIKAYLLNSNGWDPAVYCKATRTPEAFLEQGRFRTMTQDKPEIEPDTCCGEYPKRFPYKTEEIQ